jgi:RNA polymerase sigma-70 factor (ECF subfamily)
MTKDAAAGPKDSVEEIFSGPRILWRSRDVLETGPRRIARRDEDSDMADGNLAPEAFSQLMADLRPSLHRYCARMVGSAFDGEDVVQEALAKAAVAFPTAEPIEHPDRWLFRIAHNAALDALRGRKRHALLDETFTEVVDPVAAADARVAATASLAVLLRLPVAQRSCVVLIDVLGHSLEETAHLLDFTLPATKAALHRGRVRLKDLAEEPEASPPRLDAAERERLRAYADRFNARDFDALRALLSEDVRLDLANRRRIDGRKDVSVYFTHYASTSGWWFEAGVAEGRPALLVSAAEPERAMRYVVLLDWNDGEITAIHDYFYAPYVMNSLAIARG